eukprot:CAMPEP_0116084566 /NCGR_PEP_ID=MMETSP0327-20121206/3866_1 /TAXON_ID=44447 /ORGANISM="Pseudo-nitzschia delicatissima, Strain B596" /LENGTH=339 /DNA_ID=CAMNT_0003575511 /DNA_START=74 /DNA_END=1093 /DNA_ORIENTATION=-
MAHTHSETAFPRRRRRRSSSSNSIINAFGLPSLMLLAMLITQSELTNSFGLNQRTARTNSAFSQRSRSAVQQHRSASSTALNIWWFGGSDEQNEDDESCELVAVRIERPTSNSRKIAGELSVPGVTVDDVWSILTDYDKLSIHVPNLKESKIVRENNGYGSNASPGDGSYKCQLFQVGAQKIIGFDFSASVTMDMTEQILSASTSNARKIHFKCAKSQFFSTFDGSWTVQEQANPATGEMEVLCSYDVLVKPKGPVPVAALEWRIREDVPTNLRAVKAATLGKVEKMKQVEAASNNTEIKTMQNLSSSRNLFDRRPQPRQLEAVMVDWERGETMAKYLE